jgi:hypothetical protein
MRGSSALDDHFFFVCPSTKRGKKQQQDMVPYLSFFFYYWTATTTDLRFFRSIKGYENLYSSGSPNCSEAAAGAVVEWLARMQLHACDLSSVL